MTRGRLIRACCTWSLLALTLAALALWLLSGWRRLFFYGPAPGSYVDGKLEAGRLEAVIIYPVESSFIHPSFGVMKRPDLARNARAPQVQAVDEMVFGSSFPAPLAPPPPRFYWWGRWWASEQHQASLNQTYMTAYIQAPLWPPTAALLTLLALPFTIRRLRRRAGRCTACGYNRHGLTPDAPCPECGTGYHRSESAEPFSEARGV
jgi:hypothetical protein